MTEQTHADLIRASYHESGHIVAAQAFGRPIIAHSIDRTASRGPHVAYAYLPNATNADLIREELIIMAAGPIASRLYDPTADPSDQGDASDMIATGWKLCGRLVNAEVHHHELQLAERRAAKLIRDNWAHVEQVAHSLVAHHRLVERGPSVSCVGDLDA